MNKYFNDGNNDHKEKNDHKSQHKQNDRHKSDKQCCEGCQKCARAECPCPCNNQKQHDRR